jgi:hypothetical protein
MGTKPMKPNGAMRTHDDHAVNKTAYKKFDRNVFDKKNYKEREHADSHYPADQGYPVPFVSKNINAGKSFFE